MRILTVRNIEQAAAWLELDGQISDGMWENTRPYDHYKVWCDAKVMVARSGELLGRNFNAQKDNYNFTSKQLLDIVGRRMLGIVRIARAHGIEVASALEHAVSCDDGMLEDSVYAQKKLSKSGITYEQAMRALADTSYTMKHLMVDLNDLKATIKMRWSDAVEVL